MKKLFTILALCILIAMPQIALAQEVEHVEVEDASDEMLCLLGQTLDLMKMWWMYW